MFVSLYQLCGSTVSTKLCTGCWLWYHEMHGWETCGTLKLATCVVWLVVHDVRYVEVTCIAIFWFNQVSDVHAMGLLCLLSHDLCCCPYKVDNKKLSTEAN